MSRTLLHGMKMQWLILVHWNNWNILLGSFREETLKTIKNHALLVAKSRLQTATRLQVSGAAEANQTDERCVREPALGSNDFPVLLSSGTSEQWSMWETMAGLGSCDSFECSEDVLIRICSCFGVSNWLIDMSQEPWCKATVANLQWQILWDFVVDCRIVEPELPCQVQTELLWERVWLGRIQSHSSLSCQELPYTNGWMTNWINWINWMLQNSKSHFRTTKSHSTTMNDLIKSKFRCGIGTAEQNKNQLLCISIPTKFLVAATNSFWLTEVLQKRKGT